MDDNSMLYLVKILFHESQMKKALKPETHDEKVEIFSNYDKEFPNKVFKMTWMNWSSFSCLGMLFPKRKETWILDSKCEIGYYAEYEDGSISPIIKQEVKQEKYDMILALLNENFKEEVSDTNGADGEGWEMVLYDDKGEIIHRICGYIYGNEYLNRIVKCLRDEHGLCQFM